jgi:hypothetical protein
VHNNFLFGCDLNVIYLVNLGVEVLNIFASYESYLSNKKQHLCWTLMQLCTISHFIKKALLSDFYLSVSMLKWRLLGNYNTTW